VTLFCGAPLANPVPCHVEPLPCLKRGDWLAKFLARIMPGFTWRWGFKDPYGWEQFTFWMLLWPKLRRGKYDILHVQDPLVAYWCRLFRKLKLVKTKEILAHGTEESVDFLNQFDYLQQLAPWHLEQVRHVARPDWTAIPNFVACDVFKPIADGRQAIRANLGIPEDALVIGCVAAVKKHHKRIDYLINEFARLSNTGKRRTNIDIQDRQDRELDPIIPEPSCISCPSMLNPYLLIAGAKTDETAELIALAESLIPGRYKIMTDCSRTQMPDLLRSMDVFVLTSLFEMMPIALLEALASGLPCVVNQHPVLEWMIGAGEKNSEQKSQRPQSEENCVSVGGGKNHSSFASFATSVQTSSAGGKAIEMSQEGALAATLAGLTPEWLALHGRLARGRAVAMFSTEAVIGQYVEYYGKVMGEE
jgi:glycosyltransferase involved in cell wall biosynthesis